uniref:(northern house mosquito) hypothetical protein n=1 Tax=Culex pipiens TaxID=7175 RepID=A0A8D8KF82_CULPI
MHKCIPEQTAKLLCANNFSSSFSSRTLSLCLSHPYTGATGARVRELVDKSIFATTKKTHTHTETKLTLASRESRLHSEEKKTFILGLYFCQNFKNERKLI